MPVQMDTSFLELNQEEVTALATTERKFVQRGATWSTTRRQFVPWVTVYSLRQRQKGSKNLLNQRRKNSLRERLKQQNSQKHVDWVNSSEQDCGAMLKENGL